MESFSDEGKPSSHLAINFRTIGEHTALHKKNAIKSMIRRGIRSNGVIIFVAMRTEVVDRAIGHVIY